MKTLKRFSIIGIVFCVLFSMSAAAVFAETPDFTGKTITAVILNGNATVPEKEITAVQKIKPGDKFQADNVKQDLQAIFNLGYFFDINVSFVQVPEGVKLIYSVVENPTLNDVVFKGNSKFTADKLRPLITVKKGSITNMKTVGENIRAIEKLYRDEGYIFTKVTDVSMGEGGVLNITINEGVLEGITVKGNEKTKSYVITREMSGLKIGEPFNTKTAKSSVNKVYNLGYFEDVNVKFNPGTKPNGVIMETNVVEQKTGTFSIGGGYSQNDGMIGIITLGDKNFRGTGDSVNLHWEFGGKASNRNYSLSYTHHWLDDKQTSIGFSLYDMTNQYNDYGYNGDDQALRSTYNRNRKGFNITLGRPSGEFIQNYIKFGQNRDTHVAYVSGPVDYSQTTDPLYKDYLKNNFGLTRSVSLSRIFDNRDNVFNASEGRYFALGAEFAGRSLGGDFNFNKYTLDNRNYWKVGGENVIAVRLNAGYATGNMPESGKFAVGGADSLRGYKDDQFKGNKMLSSSIEYRFPVVKKVQGVVFGDIGKAWDGDTFNFKDMKADVGVGVRISTPIGPVRFDYAKGSEGGRTNFSFGGQF